MTKTIFLKPVLALILQIGLMFMMGCSGVREDPDDSFAPRPENAKSASYQIVRLGEGYYETSAKISLLDCIKKYREKYKVIKTASDFGDDYYSQNSYKDYQRSLQTFQDSDLDAAEEYIKKLPDTIAFKRADPDEKKYDIGDINWRDHSRKLRIVDFYGQYYTDDWSTYAFVINMIPTARDGYGKFEINIDEEILAFRKQVRKKIWSFTPSYFWVHTKISIMEGGEDQAPMILSIGDSNKQDMNGLYLVMPRPGVSVNDSIIKDLSEVERKAKLDPNYIPPPKLNYDPYNTVTKDNIDGAEYIYEQRSSGSPDMEVFNFVRKSGNVLGKDMNVRSVLNAYRTNPEIFKQRLEEVRRMVPKIESKVDSDPWSIINKENFSIADIVYGEMSRRKTAEQTLEHFREHRKWTKDEDLINKFIKLYEQDRKKYKSLLLPFRKK